MKKYYIALDVPYDFNPEELDIDIKYKDDINIAEEGFINGESLVEDLLNKVSIAKDTVGEHDVVRVTFPPQLHDYIDYESLNNWHKQLETAYKCPVIIYLDDLNVFVEEADKAIDMLNGMIAKIKVRSAVKQTSGIILP